MVALLDSVTVAGFLDRDDVFHAVAAERVRRLAGRARLIVSVITYAELLTGAGLGHHDAAGVRGFFADLIDHVHVVDVAVAARAVELRAATPSLRMPDALILATADVQQADTVVTGDRRWTEIDITSRVELLSPGGRGT